ncbi:MAG: hypothetical protein ACREEM_09405 [Blastocatellia bacterium]
MTEEFLKKLWILIKLRYRLIWAQSRTRNGRIALLFLLYMLGGSIALLFLLSGFGATIADDVFGQNGFFARWMLAGFFINGVGLSLLFGVGVREAFSDESLRHYPFSVRERFAVRQLIGLLDPIWLILITGVIGAVIGFAWLKKGVLFMGLIGALLFICANYLTTSVLLLVIGLMMRTRRGSAVLGGLALALVTIGSAAVSVVSVARSEWVWRQLDTFLSFTPPGAAAAMMVGESVFQVLGSLLFLVAWCVALALILKKLESLPPASNTDYAGESAWDGLCDQAARPFGPTYAPFVGKSLRYHLRCNMIRFSLLTSPLFVLFGKFMIPGRSLNGELIITFALFFMTSAATGAAMMLNLFGFDSAGIRRYAVLPSTFAVALRAGSFASLLLRALVMLTALALWAVLSREHITARIALLVLSIIVASLFLFNALGLWTSVLAAKRSDLESMWNNRLSFGGNVVMLGGMAIPYVIAVMASERVSPAEAARFWWVPALLMILCIGFYAYSLKAIEPVLESRKERLINLIAGASDS